MAELKGTSLDILKENMEKMKQYFPEAFEEGKINFDILRQILGEYVDDAREKYQFTWNGKGKALHISQTPSLGTLRPCHEKSKNWDSTENLYIEGDNLEVLKILQRSYHRAIKMIYIDPPYNTGHDFVYKDDFKDNIENYKQVTGQVDAEGRALSANTESGGRYHTNWLNMMYPRLRLARNLLADDGVVFISIDDNEIENLRKICNEIFGEENFLMQIAWRRTDNQPNIGNYARVKEYILGFARNIKQLKLQKLPLTEKAKKEYRYHDEQGTFRRAILLDKTRGHYYYPVTTKSGHILNGPWMLEKGDFETLDKSGGIYWTSGGDEQPYGKIYLKDSKGQIPNDFWGIEFGTNQRASDEINKLFGFRIFDFAKPSSLILNLVAIGTGKNDIVLDFFSGSATTAQSVMQLNKEDSGKRKFIMIQLPEECSKDSQAYKNGFKRLSDIGEERIRLAGERIKASTSEDNSNILDIGFKVFQLDSSNIKRWNPDKKDLAQSLWDYVDNFVEGRTEEDVVYEIMLKTGIDLSCPVEKLERNGHTIYSIGMGALFICLDDHVNEDVAKVLTALHQELSPETWKVVFRDNAFDRDADKTNVREMLKCEGLDPVDFLTI